MEIHFAPSKSRWKRLLSTSISFRLPFTTRLEEEFFDVCNYVLLHGVLTHGYAFIFPFGNKNHWPWVINVRLFGRTWIMIGRGL